MEKMLTVYVGSIEDSMNWWVNKLGADKVFQSEHTGIVKINDNTLLRFTFWPEDPVDEIIKQSDGMWDKIKSTCTGETIIAESDTTIEEFYNNEDDNDPRAA